MKRKLMSLMLMAFLASCTGNVESLVEPGDGDDSTYTSNTTENEGNSSSTGNSSEEQNRETGETGSEGNSNENSSENETEEGNETNEDTIDPSDIKAEFRISKIVRTQADKDPSIQTMNYENGEFISLDIDGVTRTKFSNYVYDDEKYVCDVYLVGFNIDGTEIMYHDYYNTTFAFTPINNKFIDGDMRITKTYFDGEVEQDTALITKTKDTLNYTFTYLSTVDGEDEWIEFHSISSPDTVFSYNTINMERRVYKDSLLQTNHIYNVFNRSLSEKYDKIIIEANDSSNYDEDSIEDSIAYNEKNQVIYMGFYGKDEGVFDLEYKYEFDEKGSLTNYERYDEGEFEFGYTISYENEPTTTALYAGLYNTIINFPNLFHIDDKYFR